MSIIKTCKVHGDLTIEQTYNYGKGILCKPCHAARSKKWASQNKEYCTEKSIKWQKENKERYSEIKTKSWYKNHEKNLAKEKDKYQLHKDEIKEKSLERYHKNRGHYCNTRLKRLFGMTLEEYNLLSESQNHCCAICRNPETMMDNKQLAPRKLAVDHNHETNQIRGLLCFNCNIGIGKFKDSIAELEKAILYLKKYTN